MQQQQKLGLLIIFHELTDVQRTPRNYKTLIYRLFLDDLDTAILRTP